MNGGRPAAASLGRFKVPLVILCAALAITLGLHLASRERAEPARCPDGLEQMAARCCGTGQTLVDAACSGRATRCAATMQLDGDGNCVSQPSLVAFPGGKVNFAVSDWQGAAQEALRAFRVAPFALDRIEVTYERFAECTSAKQCPTFTGEPGAPVRNVTPNIAENFCRFAGGKLPTARQWLFAAAGTEARRFPWGNTGLVCRRAVFGLSNGPCANARAAPELSGARPDGATPEGVLDLAGNVAEWTVEPDGSHRARGGSYLSKVAAELKTWSEEIRSTPAPHVGFRCAYPSSSALR